MRKFAAFAVLGLAIACSDAATKPGDPPPSPPPQPLPSVLTGTVISLTTPNLDDGAVALTLHGPDIGQIQASSHYLVYTRASSSQETHVIIVGDLVAGQVLTVKVGAGHKLSDYTASLDEIAARNDALRASLSGYQLTLAAQ